MYLSLSLRAWDCDLCRFGEAWAALRAENLLTYLIDGFVASPPDPLGVSKFQTHPRHAPHQGACRKLFGFGLPLAAQEEIAQKRQLERKHHVERGVNATNHRREW